MTTRLDTRSALTALREAIEYLRSDPCGTSQRALAAAWIADLEEGVAVAAEVVERTKCECGRGAEAGSDQCQVCNAPLVECRNCNETCEASELDGAGECRRCSAAHDVDGDPDAEHREAFYADIAGGCR